MPSPKRLLTSLVPKSLKMTVARQLSPKVGFVADDAKRAALDLEGTRQRYGVSAVVFPDDPASTETAAETQADKGVRLLAFARTAGAFPQAQRRPTDRITSFQALRSGCEITPVGWTTPLRLAPVDLDCAYNFKIYYPRLNHLLWMPLGLQGISDRLDM